MIDSLIAIGAGAVITALIQWIQTYFKVESRILLPVLATVAGIGYAAFRTLLPPEFQDSIKEFVTMAFAAAVIVHQYIVRPMKGT